MNVRTNTKPDLSKLDGLPNSLFDVQILEQEGWLDLAPAALIGQYFHLGSTLTNALSYNANTASLAFGSDDYSGYVNFTEDHRAFVGVLTRSQGVATAIRGTQRANRKPSGEEKVTGAQCSLGWNSALARISRMIISCRVIGSTEETFLAEPAWWR